MAGAGGQYTIIIPSHDLVVVKQSHYKGAGISNDDLRNALRILMEAVPVTNKDVIFSKDDIFTFLTCLPASSLPIHGFVAHFRE